MIFFSVNQDVNVKLMDGSIVRYSKALNKSYLSDESIYLSTLDDFNNLKKIFSSIGKKYRTKVISNTCINNLHKFPKQLGILNQNELLDDENNFYEYNKKLNFNEKISKELSVLNNDIKIVDLNKQISYISKKNISIVIIGKFGQSISDILCALSALRIFSDILNKQFNIISLDIFLDSSKNANYIRDKLICTNQIFVNNVYPLSINIKKICEYDFYIDTSLVLNQSYYNCLSKIDKWLVKFGINYQKIQDSQKYNIVNIDSYKVDFNLKKLLEKVKLKGKLLLYNPYSNSNDKSIPTDIAVKLLKEFVSLNSEYIIVSTTSIDRSISYDNYINLSSYSKNFLDFSYIISQMDCILTVNTSMYHIADSFFIPTIVVFIDENPQNYIKYYSMIKVICINNKMKNFSKFIFKDDLLIIKNIDTWKKLKAKRIIKLLEKF